MSIGIQFNRNARQDHSYLFSSLPGNSNANLNFLSDYAQIKNGSYGKLLKSYYSELSSDEKKQTAGSKNKETVSASQDSAKTLKEVQSKADGLKGSVDKLLAKGSDSVFEEVERETTNENGEKATTKGYDKDKIYNAVSDYVKSYNSLVDAAGDVNSSNVSGKIKSLTSLTNAAKKQLERIGITVNKDNTLSINKEDFMAGDMRNVKNLFHENGSYAYKASSQASLIHHAAEREAGKSNTYSAKGAYDNKHSAGSILSMFG